MKGIFVSKPAGCHRPFGRLLPRPIPGLHRATPWTLPIVQYAHRLPRSGWRPLTSTDRASGRRWIHSSRRYLSSPPADATTPSPVTDPKSLTDHTYLITFTCKRCLTRSQHQMSGQAYHKGTVLITCPGCTNRHVISDHLMIFGEWERSIEDILREKGEVVTKATTSAEADLEFLEDGTVRATIPAHRSPTPEEPNQKEEPRG